ncbi:MAG TPA: hypothetical protein VNM46_01340 [Xanthobacteraceae bacterium]|nr:hypothetical protein [Xanthobacteraceae bacterium]
MGVLAITVARVSYRAVAGARGERDRVAGRWIAEGCIARLRAISDAVLAENPDQARDNWRMLDSMVAGETARSLTGCDMAMVMDGRPVLSRAAAADFDTLPGMTPEAVSKILEIRATRVPLTDLIVVAAALSPRARAILEASYATLSRRVVSEPDAWVVRSRAHRGLPPTPVNVEARLVRAGTRVALTQWREW